MDRYTFETRCWLDLRFSPEVHRHFGSAYEPYQPLHGLAPGAWGPNQVLMYARCVRLLGALEALGAGSFLDVGGAEGWIARMVADRFGVEAASVDLSHEAALRAAEYCEVPAAAVDSARLPFADGAFDFVFLSEVLEHLANPVRSLLECRRVARRGVIVTTEAFAADEAARAEELAERRLSPHMDRSIFCPEDFDLVFGGWRLSRSNQCRNLPDPLPGDVDAARSFLREGLGETGLDWPAHGIVIVATRDEEPPAFPGDFAATLDWVRDWFAPQERAPRPLDEAAALPEALARRIVAPHDRSPLVAVEGGLRAPDGRVFPVRAGVPDLVTRPEEPFARSLDAVLEEAFPEDAARREGLRELARKLRFDLPTPSEERRFLDRDDEGWERGEGVVREGDGGEGLVYRASDDDPNLLSPRVLVPAAAVRGFSVEVAADGGGEEELQIFWHTLRRPVWWAGGCWTASYPADDAWHRLECRFDEGLPGPEGDELLRLRLDPRHRAGGFRLRGLEIRV